MYGLPEDFDGTFLQGRELEQVCFSRNQVYLHFGDQVEIMIEGSFSYEETPGLAAPIESKVPRSLDFDETVGRGYYKRSRHA